MWLTRSPEVFEVAGWQWVGRFATPISALLTVGRELLVAVDVYFLPVFVQFPVLWTLSARVWRAADRTVRVMRNSPCVCRLNLRLPGAGPARRRDIPAGTRTHPGVCLGLQFDA